jgi:hypothetical protein
LWLPGRRASRKHDTDLIHRQRLRKPDDHNPATPCPNSRPNSVCQWAWDKNQKFANRHGTRTKKRIGMTEQEERLARERKEIAARIASFKATQEKFKREREEYYVTTLENARNGSDGKSFWS